MNGPMGRKAWAVKIGEKGQFVIPKEARDQFDIHPGDTVLVLGDPKRGLAIMPHMLQDKLLGRLMEELLGEEETP